MQQEPNQKECKMWFSDKVWRPSGGPWIFATLLHMPVTQSSDPCVNEYPKSRAQMSIASDYITSSLVSTPATCTPQIWYLH